MADDLNDIPCSGPTVEPELPIPEKDYEECDTCAEPSEAQDGDVLSDSEIDSLLAEFNEAMRQADSADSDFVRSISRCVDGIATMMDEMESEKTSTLAAIAMRGVLDELVDNLEPFRYYHDRRAYYYSVRGTSQQQPPPSSGQVISILRTINQLARDYSTALKFDTNYSVSPEYSPTARNITAVEIKFRNKQDVTSSRVVSLSDALADFNTLSILPVGKDETFNGSLYEEYYNKLDDPLNNFFSADERGLTSTENNADSDLKRQAAANGIDVAQIASTKQNTKDFYISDQKKYSAFFQNFEMRYTTRVSEIRNSRVGPILTQLKNALDSLAKYEALLETNPSYSASCVSYCARIIGERDRLVSVETAFRDKLRIDAGDPASSQYVASVKEKLKCLGDPDAPEETAEPPLEFQGEEKDTFAFGESGMDINAPNPVKSCYWVKFASLATQYGILPFPDIAPKAPGTGLRYWPVGLVIPTPATLVKIPLPIIWFHVMTINTRFGVFVVFVTMCGIWPGLYIMYIDRSGIKKFIITPRGPSNAFGYSPTEAEKRAGFPLKIRVPLSSTFADLPEDLRQLMFSVRDAGFPPLDEVLADISKQINDAIDGAKLPEMKMVREVKGKIKNARVSIDEKYRAIYSDALQWVNDLDLPSVQIPKDDGRSMQISGMQKTINQCREFLSKKYALPSFKMTDLKQKIMPYIFELTNDPSVNRQIALLPDRLNLRVESEWQAYKKLLIDSVMGVMKIFIPDPWDKNKTYFMGQRVSYGGKYYTSITGTNVGSVPSGTSDVWIVSDFLLMSALMSPSVSIPNPLKCSESLVIPPLDIAYVTAVAAAFSKIRSILQSLEATAVIAIFGFSEIRTDSIMMYVYETFDKIIPSIPLPPENFAVDFKTVFRTMLLGVGAMDLPKIPLVSGLPPKMDIDLDMLKPVLTGIVEQSFAQVIAALPIDVSLDNSLGFPALDGATLKITLKNIINLSLEQAAEPIRPIYNAASAAFGALRLVGEQKTVMDASLSPATIPVAIAKAQLKAIADNFRTCFDDTMVVPVELIVPVMQALSKLNLPYIITGAAAAAGTADVIRQLHPLLYEDELPPWERLKLDNILFVLFLDEYCHVAKQYGGIVENYLP